MANAKGRSWKLERASVHKKQAKRPRSNKFARSDSDTRPAPHSREKIWVGGYTRADGSKISGYFRAAAN